MNDYSKTKTSFDHHTFISYKWIWTWLPLHLLNHFSYLTYKISPLWWLSFHINNDPIDYIVVIANYLFKISFIKIDKKKKVYSLDTISQPVTKTWDTKSIYSQINEIFPNLISNSEFWENFILLLRISDSTCSWRELIDWNVGSNVECAIFNVHRVCFLTGDGNCDWFKLLYYYIVFDKSRLHGIHSQNKK